MKIKVNDQVIDIPQKFQVGDTVRVTEYHHVGRVFKIDTVTVELNNEDDLLETPVLELIYSGDDPLSDDGWILSFSEKELEKVE